MQTMQKEKRGFFETLGSTLGDAANEGISLGFQRFLDREFPERTAEFEAGNDVDPALIEATSTPAAVRGAMIAQSTLAIGTIALLVGLIIAGRKG